MSEQPVGAQPSRAGRAIWISSLGVSLVVVAGYRLLEELEFLPVLALVGLTHLLTVMAHVPQPLGRLLLSQSAVVLTSVTAVVLHVVHLVGSVPPGWSETLVSFLWANLRDPSAYLYFGMHLALFALFLAGLLLVFRGVRSGQRITPDLALTAAYAASAVNIAFNYCWKSPLRHVSGEPDALTFFFAAGLFGLEHSLPLHTLLLCTVLVWRFGAPKSR